MHKIAHSFSAIAIVSGILLHAGAAQAVVTPSASRTWVSGAGNDANPCTRASPCLTFNGAYAKTSPGGEIDVLDGGDFGPLQISHALTIANDGAGTAAVTSGGGAFLITAGANDAVVLRGLNVNGVGASIVTSGVYFASGASLLIDQCNIQGYLLDPAVIFSPSGAAKLWVKDTVLSEDGTGSSGSVVVSNGNGGSTNAQFERVRILGAIGNGIRVDGSAGAGAIDVELHDVTVDGAGGGSGIVAVSATSGGPAVSITADNVTSSHNAGYGLRAVGGTASVFLSRSTIANNSVGIRASSGGTIVSYSDNRFVNNTGGDGSPTATMALK